MIGSVPVPPVNTQVEGKGSYLPNFPFNPSSVGRCPELSLNEVMNLIPDTSEFIAAALVFQNWFFPLFLYFYYNDLTYSGSFVKNASMFAIIGDIKVAVTITLLN